MNNSYGYGNYLPINNTNTGFTDPHEYQNERARLKHLSRVAGFCVIGFIFISSILGYISSVFPAVLELYRSDEAFANAYGALMTIISVMLPFTLAYFFHRRGGFKSVDLLPLGRPESWTKFFLCIPAGLFICVVGGYATSLFVAMMQSAGIKLTAPPLNAPGDPLGILMFFIRVAAVPAFIEEFALRGIIMQPLRRYGNGFAIAMSSIVFALMHGNMIQAPFALIAGAAMGYFVIYTKSLWAGIAIHFTNNAFTGLVNVLSQKLSPESFTTASSILSLAIFIIGGSCLFILLAKVRPSIYVPSVPLRAAQKIRIYFLTIPMLIAFAALIYLTSNFIAFAG